MIDGRELPDRVQWHEGMLLAPQHFQQADLRTEGLIQYHVGVASPFHWGVRRLRIDPGLLASGTLRVTEIEAILPDGLLLTDPRTAEEELTADLTAQVAGRPRGTLTVHLAVPAVRRPGQPIAGSLPRYRSVDGSAVADENTQEETSLVVPRLRPRATLLVTDAPPDKYASFPLARVAFQEETFSLADFVPPLLEVTGKSEIGAACLRLTARLRERAAFLSEKIQAAGPAASDVRLTDMQRKLEQLVVGLPALEATLASAPHPYPLYMAVCAVAGHLACVHPGTIPPVFRPYDHDDLRATFMQVLTFCGRMVEGIQQTYQVTPFALEEGAFRLRLSPAWAERPLLVGITAGGAMPESDVVSWMMESRIGSVARIPSIRERRIRGATRRPVERDDDLGVFPGRGIQLFKVEADPEFVLPGETLEISHPAQQTGRGHPVEVVLYAPAQA
jgi:type VI secretion system protein ImpJ